MSLLTAEIERFTLAVQEVQLTIADRLTPVLRHMAYDLHVVFFVASPWWRRWWHTMFGHGFMGRSK